MPRYRIIHKSSPGDPCVWQVQGRYLMFFWMDIVKFSSATTAGLEILMRMEADAEFK